jgi:hypothetical protein
MSARTLHPLSICLFATVLCNAGCDDSLKSVSLLEETRVLGARVEVEADEGRSSPNVGEGASLRLLVAAPDGQPHFSYALSVCAVRLTNNGFPPCASAPFASAASVEPSDAEARLDFRVPEEIDLNSTPHAFASGLVCPDSGLNLAPDRPASCLTGSGTEVAFEFALGGPEQNNHSPTFASDSLFFDGEPWSTSTDASCDRGSLPQVKAKSLHTLRIDLADSDFEPLTQQTSVDPRLETLLVSPFSSAGKLGHGFLALSADTPPEQRRVSWEAPAISSTDLGLVRFYFVVRDARGGQDFAQRALCIVP